MTGCRALLLPLLLVGLAACQSPTPREVQPRPFQFDRLLKGDVDVVTEIHLRHTFAALRQLAEKLYRRNPREWRKGNLSLQGAMARLFGRRGDAWLPEVTGRAAIDSMRRAFDPDFAGDRVHALIAGMGGMILQSYGGKRVFYLMDELDPQSLYNAARNLEVAAWRLAHRRAPNGQPILLSNSTCGPVRNLSFERIFGKMIALQDSMAEIVADATNRRIRTLLLNAASMMFIPI